MKNITLVISLFAVIINSESNAGGSAAFCQSMMSELGPLMLREVKREANMESPQGKISKPYSREDWDSYWNDRIYHNYDLGSHSCEGTYRGPAGTEIIRSVIERRREYNLPEIQLDERNLDKKL